MPGVRTVWRHQSEVQFTECLHVTADIADAACVARQRELELRMVMPEKWASLVLVVDVMPVVAMRTANNFADEHGVFDVQTKNDVSIIGTRT